MKKLIFPICVIVYLAFVTFTLKPNPKKYSMDFLLESIGPVPKNMIITLSLIGVLIIVMAGIYIYAKKVGEKNGK